MAVVHSGCATANKPFNSSVLNVLRSCLSFLSDPFKLVYSRNECPGLMDLKLDPEEAFNHFQDPEHASVIRQLTRDLLNYFEIEKDPYGQIPEIQQATQAALR